MPLADCVPAGRVPLWRRLLIGAIPVAAVAGPYVSPLAVGGVTLYAFRLLVIAASAVLWFVDRGNLFGEAWFLRFGLGCGGLWTAWGLASLTWANDTKSAVTDVLAVALGWLAVLVVVQTVQGEPVLFRSLRRGWVLAFALAVSVAGWELRTGQHLESSFSDQVAGGRIGNLVVISTFGNPNNFAAFLLLAVPVILWEGVETRNVLGRIALLSCLPLAGGLTILAGARLAMIGFVCEVAVLGVTLGIRRELRTRLFLGIGASLLAVAVLLITVPAASRAVAGLWTLGDELQYSGSASIRLSMIESGLLMIERTKGVGVGAGNFTDAIRHGATVGYTGGIVNPHNLAIEIAAQYGLVVAVVFGLFIYQLAERATVGWWKARLGRDRQGELFMALVGSVLVGYVFAAGENSAYINQPVHWAMLGTIVAMLTVRRRRVDPEEVTGSLNNVGVAP